MTGGEIAKATEWLSQIFPEAYLVVDLMAIKRYQEDKKIPFNEEALAQLWEEVARDEFYALYKLKPSVETQNKIIRRLRTDVLRENPLLSLQARAINTDTHMPIFFRVLVNGYEIGRYSLSLEWNRFKLRIPHGPTGNIFGEEVVLELIIMEGGKGQASGGTPQWEVKGIEFLK